MKGSGDKFLEDRQDLASIEERINKGISVLSKVNPAFEHSATSLANEVLVLLNSDCDLPNGARVRLSTLAKKVVK